MQQPKSLAPFHRRPALDNSRWFGPHLFSFLATSADTGGQFALMDNTIVAGHEPPPNTHSREDEALYVLEGEVEFQVGNDLTTARSGDFVLLPCGVEHTFRLLTPQARTLLFVMPGGLERAFLELSQPAQSLQLNPNPAPSDAERAAEVFDRHGVSFREPASDLGTVRLNPSLAVRPAIGRSRWYFGHLMTTLWRGEQSQGRIAITESLASRGFEPPPHIHHREDEAFYLIEGEVEFHCADQTFFAQKGDFVFLPRGLPHWFHLQTETARALIITTPSGLEKYFEEYSEPAKALVLPERPSYAYDPELLARAAAKYGFEFLPAEATT